MKGIRVCLLAFVLLLGMSARALQAQMFSADDNPDGYSPPVAAFFVGFEPMDFSYEGDGSATGGGVYAFTGNILRFRLENAASGIYVGTGVGLDNASYFDAGVRYGFGLPLHRSSALLVQLPIVLHSSFTSVSNDDLVTVDGSQFQHGTFEISSGLSVSARPDPRFRFVLRALPSYGFSFSTREQDAGGSITAVKGESRFYFDYLFGSAGLSLGYDYNGRRFDNEGEFLDYTASAHTILLGITF